MTNSVNEILDEDLLFVIGSNTTEAHPVIGIKMKQAVRRGTKLIVVDPRRTELAGMADLWLPLRSGTDIALINGLMHIIVKEGWQDEAYIKERCEGYEALRETIERYTPERVEAITGIPREQLREAARLYATTRKAGIFYTLGITEHICGTDNVKSLANLGLLTGHIGFPNAGINPLRGQNNVQGACDMAALPTDFPGYQKVTDPEKLAFFESLWGRKLSGKPGLKIPEMFDAAHAGTLKAMFVMGEDPVMSDPDANHVKKGFEAMEFVAVQEIFLSETAKFADVIFPATCYAEKDGTFTASERRVQRVRKAVEPPGEARVDWRIVAEVARAMGAEGFDWQTSEDVFNEMRAAIPQYRGMTYERLGTTGLQWPCPTEDHPGTPYLHKDTFSIGKAKMVAIEHVEPAEPVCGEYPILLITGRRLEHYNVMTRFSPTLDAIVPCEMAEMHPDDAQRLGLAEGQLARVTSRRGQVITRVTLTDKVKLGSIFMTLHFKESPVNELTIGAYDPVTLTAEYKVAAVRVEKVESDYDPATVERFVNLRSAVGFDKD